MGNNTRKKQLRVFISYAAKDADWPAESVEDVARSLESAGLEVWLDLRYARQIHASQTIHAWRMWINEAILGADYVVCLTSPRYLALWSPGFDRKIALGRRVQGKILVSEESMGLLQKIFNERRRRHGYICTLRLNKRDEGIIPTALFSLFSSYRWTDDREKLISHFQKISTMVSPIDQMISHAAANVAGAAEAIASKIIIDSSAKEIAKLALPTESLTGVYSAAQVDSKKKSFINDAKASGLPGGGHGMWPIEYRWRAPVHDFPPSWASAWGDDVYGLWADFTVSTTTQRMRWIEPSGPDGFLMGSAPQERASIARRSRDSASRNEHEPILVEIEDGFWLADTPCTEGFWHAVTGHYAPASLKRGFYLSDYPVERVSWDDVMKYFIGCLEQGPVWSLGQRIFLPSEEQWEYAARAGGQKAYWWGDDWDDARGNAGNANGSSSPVKKYAPNPWGLYDMHGNVWEWCSNLWQRRREWPGERPDKNARVVRGGSCISPPGFARASARMRWPRKATYRSQGFRFALRYTVWPDAL